MVNYRSVRGMCHSVAVCVSVCAIVCMSVCVPVCLCVCVGSAAHK